LYGGSKCFQLSLPIALEFLFTKRLLIDPNEFCYKGSSSKAKSKKLLRDRSLCLPYALILKLELLQKNIRSISRLGARHFARVCSLLKIPNNVDQTLGFTLGDMQAFETANSSPLNDAICRTYPDLKVYKGKIMKAFDS
jgi:hypothetical protein